MDSFHETDLHERSEPPRLVGSQSHAAHAALLCTIPRECGYTTNSFGYSTDEAVQR